MKGILKTLFFLSIFFFTYYLLLSRPRPNFVYLNQEKFYLNGEPYFPLALNYIVTLQADANELWPSPYAGYLDTNGRLFSTKDSALAQLRADMELIREMGFNTVRVTGIGEEEINTATGQLFLKSSVYNRNDSIVVLNESGYKSYFSALKDLFRIIDQSGLKLIFLTKVIPEVRASEQHLIRLADRFRHSSVLMAYDLFNEPLYFDKRDREKKDIFHFTRKWKSAFRKHAPDQLLTVGLVGVREVFEWDPNAVNVDFISFHPYEFERGQVLNEMYWFGKVLKKPWIIGETGLAADNDSITYEQQKKFAKATLEYCVNAGGAGYSWWQFKDVKWKEYHASYLGVLNRQGNSKTKSGKLVSGSRKPVYEVFGRFKYSGIKGNANQASNYYNFSAQRKYRYFGKLVNQDNQPLANGVVMAWTSGWLNSFITFTKDDGSFELFTEEAIHDVALSASVYTVMRGDIKPEDIKPNGDGTFSINAGTVGLWQVYY